MRGRLWLEHARVGQWFEVAAGENLVELVDEGGVDDAVGGQGLAGAAVVEGAAVHVGDGAAGFGDEEGAGGDVPGIEVEFPEAVEAPGGGVGQVEGSGAGAAHAVRAHGDLVVEVDVGILVAFVGGKPVASRLSESFFVAETWSGLPFSSAPEPFPAEKSSSRVGS